MSKPIQYHTARQLVLSNKLKNCKLIVLGNFYNSDIFFNRLSEFDPVWDDVIYYHSRIKAYLHLVLNVNNANIFLDSDYGKDAIFVFLMNIKNNIISLYEEGQFSYEESLFDYYKNRTPLKVLLYRFLFFKPNLGSTKSIRNYFVYDLDRFLRTRESISDKGKLISLGFSPNQDSLKIYRSIFGSEQIDLNKNVLLYVGSKFFDELLSIESLKNKVDEYDVIIFKPHPGSNYCKESVAYIYSGVEFFYLDNLMPVELIIEDIKCEMLTIIHHDSSVDSYLNKSQVITKLINANAES
ncbi:MULTISPECIES: hypothetical protein [unclassified Aliivibrio]|uniref:polysialyltransferase family glycosyltransferase n=1 Tax=unclassified Aliivibrio TaxID=2645654 RepID=UPI0011468698|nr:MULTISPECIES: hypothetical protein [unclassified Aliivibrio]